MVKYVLSWVISYNFSSKIFVGDGLHEEFTTSFKLSSEIDLAKIFGVFTFLGCC